MSSVFIASNNPLFQVTNFGLLLLTYWKSGHSLKAPKSISVSDDDDGIINVTRLVHDWNAWCSIARTLGGRSMIEMFVWHNAYEQIRSTEDGIEKVVSFLQF